MMSLGIYTRIATLSAAALLIATPALAQSTTPEKSDAPAAMEQPQSGAVNQPMATDETKTDAMAESTVALGQAVWSSDGEELGKVSKVNLDASGKLESIHFNVGALLGIGGKTVLSQASSFSQNKDRVDLKIDAKAANALPAVKA